MNILGITSRVPYPPTDGARICMYQAVRSLAALGHTVHLVAVEDEEVDAGPLAQFCTLHQVRFRPIPTMLGAGLTLFNERPYTVWKKDIDRVYPLLDSLQAQHQFDAMYVDQAHVAQYGAYMKSRYGLPYFLRSHNVEHEIYRRHLSRVTNPLMRRYLALQSSRWQRFEVEQTRRADTCAAITQRDLEAIRAFAPGLPLQTIPAAVDLSAFPFRPVAQRETNSMIMLGNMGWAPNRDSAIWFANEILPLIAQKFPSAICHLVGADPPLRQLPTDSPNLKIHGRVSSIRELYDRVAIGLIPLRVGGGMRVKMVEMMSAGIPIVSTAIGAEGNSAEPGRHYLSADQPEAFADAVVQLLNDAELRASLSQAAFQLAQRHYSLDSVGCQYQTMIQQAVDLCRKRGEAAE
ncbi:MAG: glycosyltransferase [Chlorobi bacterium]|jgi:glycosyltransferase involved in cell wall biosynthesis|nr:glycosyltransferase [Chlorobiota bacterium]